MLISFVLTMIATGVLLGNMQAVSSFAAIAAGTDGADAGRLRDGLKSELLHAGVGLLVLLVILVLNVYKPRGMTAYGRRRQQEGRAVPQARSPSRAGMVSATLRDDGEDNHGGGQTADDAGERPRGRLSTGAPRWLKRLGIIALVLIVLFVLLHLAGRGLGDHAPPPGAPEHIQPP